MAKFNGTWKTVAGSKKGFDEFMKALGMPDEMIAGFKDALPTHVYEVNGDDVKVTALLENLNEDFAKKSNMTSKTKTYCFKFGQELTDTDLSGNQFKMTCNLVADDTMRESGKTEITGWTEIITTRKLMGGDKMLETQEVTINGKKHEWSKEMKRVK